MAAKTKESNPAAVDAWIEQLPHDQRTALQQLREQILAAAPSLVATIAYGVPMFYVGTTPVLGLSAAKNHVAFGVGSETLDTLQDELAGYDRAKDIVRFSPDQPLPAALVKKIVHARLAQHAAEKAAKKAG